MSHDPIHTPAHYTVFPIQPIEITRHLNFCLGNAVKYVLRASFKGGMEDITKALKYLEWEKEEPQPHISHISFLNLMEKTEELVGFLNVNSSSPWMEEIMARQSNFLDCMLDYLNHGRKGYLAVLCAYAEAVGDAIEADHCRVCGCTDEYACEGGCWWVEEDLCSTCAGSAPA